MKYRYHKSYSNIRSFDLLENVVYHLDKSGNLLANETVLSKEVDHFAISDRILSYTDKSLVTYFIDLSNFELLNKIQDIGFYPGAIKNGKALIVKFLTNPIRLDSLSRGLLEIEKGEFIKEFKEIKLIIGSYVSSDRMLIINDSKRELHGIDLFSDEIAWSKLNNEDDNLGLFVGGDSEFSIVQSKTDLEGRLVTSIEIIKNESGDQFDSWSSFNPQEFVLDELGLKNTLIPNIHQCCYIPDGKKLIGLTSKYFWQIDIKSKKIETISNLRKYFDQLQIETFSGGIINRVNNHLFLCSKYYDRGKFNNKLFAFDINTQEIVWEYQFNNIPNKHMLNMTSPLVNDQLIVVKDSLNRLHVLERIG